MLGRSDELIGVRKRMNRICCAPENTKLVFFLSDFSLQTQLSLSLTHQQGHGRQ
jgi:hypothetical protein